MFFWSTVTTNTNVKPHAFPWRTIPISMASQFSIFPELNFRRTLMTLFQFTVAPYSGSNSFAKSCTSINCTFLLDTSLIICHEVKRELLQKFRVSCYIYPSTRLTLVSHISLFMSWTLIEPPEKSEDEDSDFYVISEESTDEEDNGLRQEYHTDRARLHSRKEFEIV